MTEATLFFPGLSPVGRKSLTAAQDAGNLTSNGGLIALRNARGAAAHVALQAPAAIALEHLIGGPAAIRHARGAAAHVALHAPAVIA